MQDWDFTDARGAEILFPHRPNANLASCITHLASLAPVSRHKGVQIMLQAVDDAGQRLYGDRGYAATANLTRPQRPQLVPLPGRRVAVIWIQERARGRWSLHRHVVTPKIQRIPVTPQTM